MNGIHAVERLPAAQQPQWAPLDRLAEVGRELAALPGLVAESDVRDLRRELARVAEGEAHVVQAGDCAEDPAECNAGDIARKVGVLDLMAGRVRMSTHRPVLRVGRIAGQFAKPRSKPTELFRGVDLPVFRGHIVNSPDPDLTARRPDPDRLLMAYHAAAEAMGHLGWSGDSPRSAVCAPVWTSHEALLLAYEVPLLREDSTGGYLLASTHWPWIGERTRDPEGAHVALLAQVSNPVACKVGPTMEVEHLLALCAKLDPNREPGRLTLIARMGADLVDERLPSLVRATRSAGHPVIWLTDPMHGNTVPGPDGLKTRFVDDVVTEVERFQSAVRACGGIAGGLHLETTPDQVTECVRNASQIAHVPDKYLSHCDPRLNPDQATTVASAWRG
ncbi:3-deoxy-7-phosphoheptulonate synthase [Actinokineospora globicatena]|uniref:3-deoxy-7-phosphoheptulonate synthase n=1 Tax=Actinokineospora globicatena TaxID=103729 RepID=UPI0020A23A34|nr:3-deoxy-7-phosphoheptulonate synthase [Actinokineospora globicatena]MCP2303156.1 3-deoxy-D-arabinoheptulosonate-7-phosphate synthase [Actinokineospora globicatena]GLW79727.1 phospho-2-dehydro-3-deoxyheptonate aldolase [Actinokineospora globicatena]GLW85863.1 phospho-2-dehydro-3-deoxyheptonate aldolase [Actinokineospora globicatena]